MFNDQHQQVVELPEAPPKKNDEIGKSAEASVYTFGFGSDHNPDMLTKISEAGNGMYYYIENEDKVFLKINNFFTIQVKKIEIKIKS